MLRNSYFRHLSIKRIPRQIFEKIFEYRISRNSVQWEPNCSMRAGGRTGGRTNRHDEANSCLSQFCERVKTKHLTTNSYYPASPNTIDYLGWQHPHMAVGFLIGVVHGSTRGGIRFLCRLSKRHITEWTQCYQLTDEVHIAIDLPPASFMLSL